ncbi:ABC transporter permease [Vagococcus sp. BWB3-3]|uniref:ABC transporter permease n=1 Tax=Vagococcus allomyrinae TaxID=2794353 RepID=A0A940PE40_9ENTE|nr:ABC transporter permease [Vagococcus allomyrinae]MBP1044356.1 ABC transporter permease [Vagococcus allomyrinae]
MILVNLAIKNVKTQLQSYLMYFVSMAFSVMVYYSFRSMSYDKNLVERIGVNNNLAGSLQAASIMIVLFILVFMFSANSFFLKKRKKEIGLYNLLGMRKLQISFLFFMENCVIGLVALGTGLLAGIIFSKLFAMLLIRAMYLELDSGFAFSLQAVQSTSLMFLLILSLVSLRSGRVVYRTKLVDLFKAMQKGDRIKKTTIFTWLMGLTGVGLLIYGYYQAVHIMTYSLYLNERTQSDMGFLYGIMLILAFCVLGSYLFFHGFTQIMISVLQQLKSYYYRDIHMVTTGGLRFHLKKNATTLGTIAVLSGTALAAIGGATNVYSFGMETVNMERPMDFVVDSRESEALKGVLADYPTFPVKDEVVLTLKQVAGSYEQTTFEYSSRQTGALSVLSLSNYNALQQVNPFLKKISLTNSAEVVLFDRLTGNPELLNEASFGPLVLQSMKEPLKIKEQRTDALGGFRTVRYNQSTIVVTDQLFDSLPAEGGYRLTMINVKNGADSGSLAEAVESRLPVRRYQQKVNVTFEQGQVAGQIQPEIEISEAAENRYDADQYERISLDSRYPALKDNRITFGTLVYIAIFLGVVFLFATGSIIMLKQLSEAEEEKMRYQMLRKIGVSRKMIANSVYRQNFLVFFAPLAIAYLHSKYALSALNYLIATSNNSLTWLSRGFLLVIYSGFYLGTAAAYNRIVNE